MANYAINGFGRIGRSVLRALIDNGELENVVAINDLTDNETLAHLLKYDSTQGKLDAEVSFEDDFLVVNSYKIHATAERDPAALPWAEWDIDAVFESTGSFCSCEGAFKHHEAGAKEIFISNSFCTTDCLAPFIKVSDSALFLEATVSNFHSQSPNSKAVMQFAKKLVKVCSWNGCKWLNIARRREPN